jgi:peptidoglycan/LPS O-acetylase OafA/YrhL
MFRLNLSRIGHVLGLVTERPGRGRVAGLDGLRFLAALYVMLFHSWLLAFRHFPHNTGPGYLTWAMYGRLSVVFFLALSGFSLALGPAAGAWRILPAYWAALAFSLVIAYHVPASHKGEPTHRSIAVFGLLLQDVFWAKTPNGAFWSVAVEVELYALFPLFLLIRRRLGAVVLLAAVTVPVLVYGVIQGVPKEGDTGLTPHLAPVFVAGIVAAGVKAKLPWHWMAAAATLPVIYLIHFKGSYWAAHHYFWIDLAITPGLTMLIVAVATGRAPALTRVLSSRPLERLGRISYSLYLIHLPILTVLAKKVAPHYAAEGPHTWIFVVVVGVPLSVLAAWLFAQVFELPFQRHRSWKALAAAMTSVPRRSPTPPAATDRDPAGNRPRYPGADAPSPAPEAAGTPLPPTLRRTSDGFDLSRP